MALLDAGQSPSPWTSCPSPPDSPSTFMIWYVSWTTLYLGSFRKACAQAWIRYRILFRTFTSTCLCREEQQEVMGDAGTRDVSA